MNIRVSTYSLAAGVIIPIMAPLNTSPAIFKRAVRAQAARLAQVKGVSGVAVKLSTQLPLTASERMDLIRETRKGLRMHQSLWADVGVLSEVALKFANWAKDAGASAVITNMPKFPDCTIQQWQQQQLFQFADRLTLPTILSLDGFGSNRSEQIKSATRLARVNERIFGLELGCSDNVMSYDRDYYALKTLERPLAVLTSSDAALFHNLNTGSDGVLSDLAYLAPHETCALFAACQAGDFFEAQALHNKLAPLIRLLNEGSMETRDAIIRLAAQERGLLADTTDHAGSFQLQRPIVGRVLRSLDEINLRPINWVW